MNDIQTLFLLFSRLKGGSYFLEGFVSMAPASCRDLFLSNIYPNIYLNILSYIFNFFLGTQETSIGFSSVILKTLTFPENPFLVLLESRRDTVSFWSMHVIGVLWINIPYRRKGLGIVFKTLTPLPF